MHFGYLATRYQRNFRKDLGDGMRVWVADDLEAELCADIKAAQKFQTKGYPQVASASVLGVSSVDELKEKVEACSDGKETPPSVIFQDLSFESREEGIEALRYVKFHPNPDIRNIPVVMYSQSDNPADVYGTLHHRANAYMTKESGLEGFWRAVAHWHMTQLPPIPKPEDPDLDHLILGFDEQ